MKISKVVIAALGAAALCACDNSAKQNKEMAEQSKAIVEETLELTGEQRFENIEMEGDVVVKDKEYHYVITRKSSDDLPMVQGDFSKNAQFHDNIVTLKIVQGERQVFSKTYTKNDFSAFIDNTMLKHSVLRGFAYYHELDNGIQFAVAVGYPQDDEMFVPILLNVMADGTTSMEKDPMMDDADRPDGGASADEEGV